MYKYFKYRLYPSNAQRIRLESTLDVCRRFYNDCLSERRSVYEQDGRYLGRFEQKRRVKLRKASDPSASTVPSHALQAVVDDLQKSFDAFFRRVKNGGNPGYPRFKSAGRFNSFGLNNYGNGCKIDGRRLRIFGVGRIAVRWHRQIEGKIKTLRVSRKAGKWYASFCCEVEAAALQPLDAETGIDAGLTSLFVLSNGDKIANPRWYRASQAKRRILQRAVSRKKQRGSNRRKAVRRLAKFSEHIANQRRDFLNKLVCWLSCCFGRIAIEDLSISRMVHGNLAKSILDAGWGCFKQRLLAKAESAGRTVTLVNPAYTSQDCCQCGQRQKLTLKDRWYSCPCGNSRDRDENAALNILAAGRAVWALSSSMDGLAQEAVPH